MELELLRRRCTRPVTTPERARADPSYLPLHAETPQSTIEAAFTEFTERSDIAILLINQHVRPLSLALDRRLQS